MSLGLGSNLSKGGIVTPRIVTDNLVLKHNYSAGAVVPVSDGAAFFDGTDDYISISSQTYDIDGSNVSFAFWAKRTDTTSQNIVLGNTNSGYMFINLHSNGSMYIESNTNEDSASAAVKLDNNWHHYAVICSSGTVSMYEDGVSLSMNDDSVTDDITISKISYSSSRVFTGYICNLGIWNGTALTGAQVKSIMWKNYAGLTDSEKTNLVSWWNLSADANDSHGSNNGTLS